MTPTIRFSSACALLLMLLVPPRPIEAEEPLTAKELSAQSSAELIRLFEGSPYGTRRPIADEMISRGDAAFATLAVELMQSEDGLMRCNAAYLAAGLDLPQGVPDLIDQFVSDRNSRRESTPSPQPRDKRRALFEPRLLERYCAALALGRLQAVAAVPVLIEALEDPAIAYRAALSLGYIGREEAVEPLIGMAEALPEDRHWAGSALSELGDARGIALLIDVAADVGMHWTQRRHAISALERYGAVDPSAAGQIGRVLCDAMMHPEDALRMAAESAVRALALPECPADAASAGWSR